jgi:hypothetical protein
MARSYDSKERRGAGHENILPCRSGPCPRLEFFRVMPNVSEASAVGKIGGKRRHSAKKAVFAGMARSYDSKERRGPCPGLRIMPK